MSPINLEPLDEVLAQYNLTVLDTRNENYKEKKGVWWVNTPEGYKILKKVSCSEKTLKFLLAAVEHLIQNGVLLPRVYKTNSGTDYAMVGDVCFTLTEAISGINPSYFEPAELEAVVKALGNFHKASAGFNGIDESKPKDHLGTWVEDYTKILEEMNTIYQGEVQAGGRSPVGQMILTEFPYFYERGQKAINYLAGQEYRDWVGKIQQIGCLVHQDFAAGNLILNPTAGLYVIDTDSIAFDLPARDIRKLFNKIMKKLAAADAEMAGKIVGHYQSANPLTYNEWKVVKYDLMFPHLFFGAMSKYYDQKEPDWTDEKYMKKVREMAEIEKLMAPIYDNLDAIVQNVIK